MDHSASDRVPPDPPDVDLDAIAGDLADVERSMERLQEGTYWTDEVTGELIPDDYLATNPTARRAPAPGSDGGVSFDEVEVDVEADDPAEFSEMSDVVADLDEAADRDEIDIAELDSLADTEFLAELARLDGDDIDDLDVELVVDDLPLGLRPNDPPPHPPAVHPPHPPAVHPPHPPAP